MLCLCYSSARLIPQNQNGNASFKNGRMDEWTFFSTSNSDLQMFLLVGRREPSWRYQAFEIIDKHLRTFILAAVEIRNTILSPPLIST
jgi:hypothetical protein